MVCALYLNRAVNYKTTRPGHWHILMLTFDTLFQIPFARYVARNNILNLKRYETPGVSFGGCGRETKEGCFITCDP